MKLKFSTQEVIILVTVTLMSLLANLPEGYGSNLFNRKFLLGTVVAVAVIAMFRYLQLLLLLIISILAIGANLPQELADSLNVSRAAAMAALGLLVGITLLNRIFHLLPTHAAGQFETPDAEAEEEEDFSRLDGFSARLRMQQAIGHGDMASVRKLLEAGFSVNFTLDGSTPLHMATAKGYSNIVKLLIDHGADLLAQDKDGQTPLDIALTIKKHVKTTNILYDATIPLLNGAAEPAPGAHQPT